MKLFFILLLPHLLRILLFTVFCFQFQAYASQKTFLNELAQQLVSHKPDIIYFSDTNHNNFRLLSVYTMIVSHVKKVAPEYNCIFLELDPQIFQPAIDDFMNRKKSWKDSVGIAQKQWIKITLLHCDWHANHHLVGIAQKQWIKITGQPHYDHIPKPFLNRMRELGLKVFAVD